MKYRRLLSFWVLVGACPGFLFPQFAHALTNGVALTPPMGYNSWYGNGSGVTEAGIKAIVDTMATNGMRAAGYEYICLDDGWAHHRAEDGTIVEEFEKFPSGIKGLADYVHSKGFKFGIYTVFGPLTCANRPGSYMHEVQDANTYAQWGVDFVKYEGCSFPDPLSVEYEKAVQMRDALKATGRPIVFSMSTGPTKSWFPEAINMWRGTGDHDHSWENNLYHLDFCAQTPELAGPGGWNDPDVLDIGFGKKETENKAIFSMYCILASPILTSSAGNAYLHILTNSEAIAVNQDAAGIQGRCVSTNGDLQVWCRPLGSSNSSYKAVVLFNRGTNAAAITVNWSDLGLPNGVALVRDLWDRANEGNYTNSFTATVPGHGVKFLKVTWGTTVPLPSAGTNYLSDLDWMAGMTNHPSLEPQKDKSWSTKPMRLHGITYTKGIGAAPYSRISYHLGGVASRFQSSIGVDDEAGATFGSVIFRVYADGTLLYDSGIMRSFTPTKNIDVDLTGKQRLVLEVTDGGDGDINDYADWANARIIGQVFTPATPAGLTVGAVANRIDLTWYANSGATGYIIQRSTNNGGPYQTVGTSNISSFTDTNVSGNVLYYYVISATNQFGTSPASLQSAAILAGYWNNTIWITSQAWNNSANWTNSVAFPNNNYIGAFINADIASNQVINLNQAITIGTLTIGDRNASAAYTLSPNGGTIQFNNGPSPSAITQLATSKGDTLAADISFNNTLNINNFAAHPLTISGRLTGNGFPAKSGFGTLTLSGSNTFTGTMTVNQGTVQAGTPVALGTTNSGTVIKNLATLDLNGFDLGAEPIVALGAGVGTKGAIVNSAQNGQSGTLRDVTLTGNITLGGSAPWSIQGTNASTASATLSTTGNPFHLTKVGTNIVSLSSVQIDGALGDIDVQEGILCFTNATTSMGNPTNTIYIQAGAGVALGQSSVPWQKRFALNAISNTTSFIKAAGSNTLAGPIELNGTCILDVSTSTLTVSGKISGPGELVKQSDGKLFLAASNDYSGDTIIQGGALCLTGSGSISQSRNVAVGVGAILDVTGRPAQEVTFSNSQTLHGKGVIKGNVTFGSGSSMLCTRSSGSPEFQGSATFALGGVCIMELGQSPSNYLAMHVAGKLTYGGLLMLTNLNASTIVAGDSFKIFNAASYAGAFVGIEPQFPRFGLLWDTSQLATSGALRVVPGTLPRIEKFRTESGKLIFSGRDGKPNASYYLLCSTNVGLPLYLWTPVATNQFDGIGNFSITNLVSTNSPRMFYRLQFATGSTLPRMAASVMSGTNFVLSGSGGLANANYYVLGTTNLASPVSQWSKIATNQFDGSGSFFFARPFVSNSPAMFYRLELP